MAKYRKKPVVIEAILYDWDDDKKFADEAQDDAADFMDSNITISDDCVEIETLEGTMCATKGDYIIKGVNGEFYPIKADIFKKTYEAEPQPKQLNMTRPLQRMIMERAELTERLDKLKEFLAKDKPMFVEQQQWDLLKNQKIAMDAYHAVLSARIELMSN